MGIRNREASLGTKAEAKQSTAVVGCGREWGGGGGVGGGGSQGSEWLGRGWSQRGHNEDRNSLVMALA